MSKTSLAIDQKTYGMIQAALKVLPQRVATRVIRVALSAWGGIVKRAEISNIHRKRSGALAKSPIVKVTIPDASFNAAHHGRSPSVGVGPGRRAIAFSGFVGGQEKRLTAGKARKHFSSGGRVRVNRPSRYAHLVMKGIAGTKHVAPDDFITPAVEVGRSAGMAVVQEKISSGIAEEAAKIAKGR